MILSLRHNNKLILFLIALISAIIFIPFIGNCPLFDWDEVNFAECAREMLVSGDYSHVQMNFRPFWEKPPFFIWLQAISMNLFGINEFAARFPNAACSIVTLVSLYTIGKKIHSQKFGLIWCFLYTTSLLPHFYFKSGIIDPWYNLFIFLSVFNCLQFLNNPGGKKEILNALAAGFFLGMAVLTKGPAALLISALTLIIYVGWNRQLKLFLSRPFLIFAATTVFVGGSWFLVEWLKGNGKIIAEFIDYQVRLYQTGEAGHGGPFYYHFVVLLLGCFPSSLLFLASYMKYKELTPYQRQARRIFICLFWVVLIVFSIVKTKIIHYSSLCYFPITFVAALGLVQDFTTLKLSPVLKVVYWLCAGLISAAFTIIGFIDYLKAPIINSGLIKDDFAIQNIQADVHWTGFEFLIGLLFFCGSLLIYIAINKHNLRLLYSGLFLCLVFIFLSIVVIVPKIELYTQNAAIEFYKSRAKKHCYVETQGFKSYASVFYSNRLPGDYTNPDQLAFISTQLDVMEKEGHSRLASFSTSNVLWMEYGNIDRPAYIVIKTKEEKNLLETPGFTKLYHKNGFSFFVRMPSGTDK